jgi:hypothetical protein
MIDLNLKIENQSPEVFRDFPSQKVNHCTCEQRAMFISGAI